MGAFYHRFTTINPIFRNYVPTPMMKLKEIQNRKDVEFNFVLLWPKLKLKTKIDLPER